MSAELFEPRLVAVHGEVQAEDVLCFSHDPEQQLTAFGAPLKARVP